MKIVCAWCHKQLGQTGTEQRPITHGICPSCADAVLSLEPLTLSDYLDRFRGPIVMISPDVRIVGGNREGCEILGKSNEALAGLLGGEAIECAYATLPGGCGETIHCRTCTIRNTVTDSLVSGRSHLHVPAYADLHHVSGDKRLKFLISTERIGRAVLLRIDNMSEADSRDADTRQNASCRIGGHA